MLIGPFMTGPDAGRVATSPAIPACICAPASSNSARRGAASLGAGKLTTGEPDAEGQLFKVPQGISLWGRLFEEGRLLNFGIALEAGAWRRRATPAASPT